MNPVDLVEAFIERSQRATQLDDLTLIAESTLKCLGFRFFACASHVDPLNPRDAVMVLNYPRRWVRIFSERQYHLIDPVFTYANLTLLPFHWDDPRFRAQLTASQRSIMAHARQFGIEHGYTIPYCLPVLRGSRAEPLMGSCSLVPARQDLPRINYVAASRIACHLFVAVARLQGIKFPPLSPRKNLRASLEAPDEQPLRSRLRVPAGAEPPGIYHISLHAAMGRKLFTGDDDYARFETQLATTLKRTGAGVLAYCWLPQSIHFMLQTHDVPSGRILQSLMSAYVRRLHAHTHESGPQLDTRHWKMRVDPERTLLPLLRYIHQLPLAFGVTSALDSYPHSSHQAYLGRKKVAWLISDQVWRALGAQQDAQAAYASLMAEPPTWANVQSLMLAGVSDARVQSNDTFLTSLFRNRPPANHGMTLDTIVTAVLTLLQVRREELFSKSKRHRVALARAVIAWHAQDRGIATLAQVARHLGRARPTISNLLARHPPLAPELFRRDSLDPILKPLEPLKKPVRPKDVH